VHIQTQTVKPQINAITELIIIARFKRFSYIIVITTFSRHVMKRVGSKAVKLIRNELLLFKNSDYVAINKMSGYETISGKQPNAELQEILRDMELLQETIPIPINSMKTNMSGVQVLSMNHSAGKLARTMVKAGQFWRCKYWGFIDGRIQSGRESIINIPIQYGVPCVDGEPSITHWKLIKSDDINGNISLLEFEPRTSVENQIQLHCELVFRRPLVKDPGLHLYSVSACLPGGDNIEIVAPPVGEFKNKMQSLGWI
jgi:23S rRNA-/tRNA-specific pseudouridylate synthase